MGRNTLGAVWRGIKKCFFLRVFLTRCMRMGSGLMILMSTPRALPTPAAVMGKAHPNKPQYSIF